MDLYVFEKLDEALRQAETYYFFFLFKIMDRKALQSPNLLSTTLSGTDWIWGTRERCVQKHFGNCRVPHKCKLLSFSGKI